MLIFIDTPPPKVYGLYTRENVDIYGRPLSETILLTLHISCGRGDNQSPTGLPGRYCNNSRRASPVECCTLWYPAILHAKSGCKH